MTCPLSNHLTLKRFRSLRNLRKTFLMCDCLERGKENGGNDQIERRRGEGWNLNHGEERRDGVVGETRRRN